MSQVTYARAQSASLCPPAAAAGRPQVEPLFRRIIAYFFVEVRRVPIWRTLKLFVATAWNARSVLRILSAAPDSALGQLLRFRPQILKRTSSLFLAASWNGKERLARIVDHCETVDRLGGLLKVPPNEMREVISLESIGPRFRFTLGQWHWMFGEGLLMLSLFEDQDEIYTLPFCLSSENGRIVAYIGGIQGRGTVEVLDRYKAFTKSAAGMRPRDFLIEAFRMLCRAVGVEEIRAVSDGNHAGKIRGEPVVTSFNQIWLERGGTYNGNGFFMLPVERSRRPRENIPAKKRAMYQKRYLMLDSVEADMNAAVQAHRPAAVL